MTNKALVNKTKRIMLETFADLRLDCDRLNEDNRYFFDIYQLAMRSIIKKLEELNEFDVNESILGNTVIACMNTLAQCGYSEAELTALVANFVAME